MWNAPADKELWFRGEGKKYEKSLLPQSTKRHAEGTAVGFNKEKKGARSYYPLFCTVAQTGQVLDLLHRSGNVHDSKGSVEFVTTCVMTVRERLPSARLEIRMHQEA